MNYSNKFIKEKSISNNNINPINEELTSDSDSNIDDKCEQSRIHGNYLKENILVFKRRKIIFFTSIICFSSFIGVYHLNSKRKKLKKHKKLESYMLFKNLLENIFLGTKNQNQIIILQSLKGLFCINLRFQLL